VAITPGDFAGNKHFLARSASNSSPIESRIGITSTFDGAEIAMFPFDLTDVLNASEDVERLKELVASNGDKGLRTVCVMWNDWAKPMSIGQPQAINFRPSMARRLTYHEEFVILMAAGRIPVLIDTDLVMPFADVIPWKEITVWVPLADIDRIDEHVVAFHEKLGESGLRDLQVQLRELYEKYLSVKGTARYLESFLAARLN